MTTFSLEHFEFDDLRYDKQISIHVRCDEIQFYYTRIYFMWNMDF